MRNILILLFATSLNIQAQNIMNKQYNDFTEFYESITNEYSDYFKINESGKKEYFQIRKSGNTTAFDFKTNKFELLKCTPFELQEYVKLIDLANNKKIYKVDAINRRQH